MARKEKTMAMRVEPQPLPTPQQALEKATTRVTEKVSRYLNVYVRYVEDFHKTAAVNPTQAVVYCGERAMLGQSVQQQLSQFGLDVVLENVLAAKDHHISDMKRAIRRLESNVLEQDYYQHNSTNAMQNVLNICHFRAKQVVCALLKWVVYEVEYLHTLRQQIANNEQVAADYHQPHDLL